MVIRILIWTLSGILNLGIALLYSALVSGPLRYPGVHPRETTVLLVIILTGFFSLALVRAGRGSLTYVLAGLGGALALWSFIGALSIGLYLFFGSLLAFISAILAMRHFAVRSALSLAAAIVIGLVAGISTTLLPD